MHLFLLLPVTEISRVTYIYFVLSLHSFRFSSVLNALVCASQRSLISTLYSSHIFLLSHRSIKSDSPFSLLFFPIHFSALLWSRFLSFLFFSDIFLILCVEFPPTIYLCFSVLDLILISPLFFFSRLKSDLVSLCFFLPFYSRTSSVSCSSVVVY